MKVAIRYENRITVLEVPEEDFAVMVRLDYEERLSKSAHPEDVAPRPPQEILDERFNRPDYNNWHRHNRRWDADAVPEEFPDRAAAEKPEREEEERSLREWIRKKLKPGYAEMIVRIRLDGMTVAEYAALHGEKRDTVYHRLERAEKKFREIYPKHQI